MEKKTALPKNVRQIGDILGNKRIYLEDYVVTYIHKKEKQEEKEGFLGVFLGEVQKEEGETRLFIRGLMHVSLDRWEAKVEENSESQETFIEEEQHKDHLYKENHIQKKPEEETGERKESEKTKSGRTVLEECRDYFGEMEVIGCCVIGRYPVEPMKRLMEEVPQSRRLLYHLQDQEEHLYWTETGTYEEISGYFVFYEQNRNMQEYMAEVFHEKGEDKERITDQAIKVFREKIKKKDQMHTAGMMKLASSFFVVTVLIIGAIVVTRIGSIRDTSGSSGMVGENTVFVSDNSAVSVSSGVSGEGTADISNDPAVSVSSGISGGSTAAGSNDLTASVGSETSEADMAASVTTSGDGAISKTMADGVKTGNGSVTGMKDDNAAAAENEVTAEDSYVDDTAEVGAGAATENGMTADTGAVEAENGVTADSTADDRAAEDEAGAEDVEASAQVRQIKPSYVIREGDTLADICQRYYGNLNKLDEICQENGIQDANKIMPGQKITLP